MFNKDFYPTDIPTIIRMVSKIDFREKIVLEPQAGKGNIVDYLQDNGAKEVIACELNDDLRKIVATKCKVIESDFLQLTSDKISHINFIIMNPPFSADEKHILYAWEIAPPGCEIISLCNSETIGNKYSSIRKRLGKLINDNGSYEDLGNCFTDSERKTDVEISLVHLFKPKTQEDEFEGYFDMSEEYDEGKEGVMPFNSVRDIVNRYVGAVKMFDEVMNKSSEINSLTSSITANDIVFGAYKPHGNNYSAITRDQFKKELQKASWRTIFQKLDMEKYVTKSVLENINKFVELQDNVPFTTNNIYKMFETIVGTHSNTMSKVLVEVFDRLTKHYHENRYQLEGWKTNSEFRVNRKFIINWGPIQKENGGKMGASYNDYIMDDLNKALCYVTGTKFEKSNTWWNFMSNNQEVEVERSYRDKSNRVVYYKTTEKRNQYREFGTWYDWGFFEIKGFKKGTLHVKFKDEKVWNLFNQEACKAKGFMLASSYTSDFRRKSEDIVVV